MSRPLRVVLHAAAAAALGLAVWRTAALHDPDAASAAADAVQGVLFRLRGPRARDPRIVLAAIDDESIDRIGTFPWRRDVMARLVDRLTALGARTIALDVLFLDRSASPKADAELARAVRRSGRVVLARTAPIGADGR
ncbi:MAG: CHASE2 domain-containing protein, partial [Elusimicrobia bacterium]|nr:CHASE2 domain-containing protein [Elusimicrobiota bacterium]